MTFFRQLEAIIRMSESLAKMSLSPFATEVHVDEALRLFQVSTLEAAMSGSLSGIHFFVKLYFTINTPSSGAEGFTPENDQEIVRKIEKQLKNRFPIGSQVYIQ